MELERQAGVNPIRVLVYSVPALLAFLLRRQIQERDDPRIDLFVNMSIISAAIYLIGMVTSGIMIGRLPIYVSLYGYALLPYEFDCIPSKRKASILKVTAIALYVAYYYYMLHFAYQQI